MSKEQTIACGPMSEMDKDNKGGLLPGHGIRPDLPIFPVENIKIGETLNSLPKESNPFKEQMDRMEELKKQIQSEKFQTGKVNLKLEFELNSIQRELNEAIPAYAEQNPDSLLATAYATDNPNSKFARQNPDLVLTGEAKDEFIKDNLEEKEGLFDTIQETVGEVLGAFKEGKKFSFTYATGDRSDELRKLANAMDKAVRNDEAIVIQMQHGNQVLLDPTKDGGLNMYSIDGDKTKLIASFDENGKDLLGNAQNTLAQIANHMEIDNDGLFGNLEDMRRDSLTKEQQNSKPIDELKPRPLKLEDFFKNNDGQSL